MSGSGEADYMTPAEAAAILGVSPRTLQRWARAGRIEGVRGPGGRWLLRRDAILRMARRTSRDAGGGED